jgi:short-subunit dehydrogenase
VLAARVALPIFRRQGGGTLVLVSSMLGVIQNPVVPLYVMTKFAIRGFALSLRHQLRPEPGIHVCVVLPGPMDTELFERAANHTGRRLRAVPPAVSPERGAAAVVACARRPRRQIVVGATSRFVLLAHRVAPACTELVVAVVTGATVVQRTGSPSTRGALFTSPGSGAASSTWRRGRLRRAAGDALGRVLARRGRGLSGRSRAPAA